MCFVSQSRMIGEIVLLIALAYYCQKEIRQLLNYKPRIKYFYDFTNIFEWFFLSLNLGLVITWLRFVFDDRRVSAESRSVVFVFGCLWHWSLLAREDCWCRHRNVWSGVGWGGMGLGWLEQAIAEVVCSLRIGLAPPFHRHPSQ